MAFKTRTINCKGIARKSDDPGCSLVVTLEKGPLDMKLGDQITTVSYSADETGMAEAITEIGPNNVRRILRDGEQVECHVPVEYTEWE